MPSEGVAVRKVRMMSWIGTAPRRFQQEGNDKKSRFVLTSGIQAGNQVLLCSDKRKTAASTSPNASGGCPARVNSEMLTPKTAWVGAKWRRQYRQARRHDPACPAGFSRQCSK